MVNLLPAVLVGGPPHAGKSVLFYRLTQALREHGIAHFAIRACPDGEGDWFHEGPPELVSTIRLKHGVWPVPFVQRIAADLEHRCLPFLVDMGGRPQPSQAPLLRLCTHTILLLREDLPDDAERWQRLVESYNLLPLARLFSHQSGDATITALSPVLEGVLTGLERHIPPPAKPNPVFEALVDRLAALFSSYNLHEQSYLEQAPTEYVLNVEEALHAFTTTSRRWEPEMLAPLLASLPAHTPLSVYGRGPLWLYAALAAHSDPQPFYLFDPKLPFGWVQPVPVIFGEEPSGEMQISVQSGPQATMLTITFAHDRLAYFQPEPLAFPSIPLEKGLILSGRLPYWLLTALVRLYQGIGVPWIAPYYVPENQAVVCYSHVVTDQPGDLVSISPA
ncbi:MAG TPA: CRISPR-associated protein Csx3 [Ktedonobacteraceae bacterium]|nr:CRISPR-associated protein Csx3 [Ktedonobacteraceae bacterium]